VSDNCCIVLDRLVEGAPRPEDFRLERRPLPEPGAGEMLVRNLFASVDPGSRGRLSGRASYAPPLRPGQVMEAQTVGLVVQSDGGRFAEGDLVAGALGLREFAVTKGRGMRRIADWEQPISTAIGIYGTPGMTAYFGMLDVGQPEPGQTVLVSAAAGTVGSAAGQLAALRGARVVGIAGGAEKCRYLREALGFAGAIDYKAADDLADAIGETCPDGVDVYFDNVGGVILQTALGHMADGGRIVICGQISQYNREGTAPEGLVDPHPFIYRRLRMQGFVVFDYADRFEAARREMRGWIEAGRLQFREHVLDGLERAPEAYSGLFQGENFGRGLVRIGELA
jgi:hypothetical protein